MLQLDLLKKENKDFIIDALVEMEKYNSNLNIEQFKKLNSIRDNSWISMLFIWPVMVFPLFLYVVGLNNQLEISLFVVLASIAGVTFFHLRKIQAEEDIKKWKMSYFEYRVKIVENVMNLKSMHFFMKDIKKVKELKEEIKKKNFGYLDDQNWKKDKYKKLNFNFNQLINKLKDKNDTREDF